CRRAPTLRAIHSRRSASARPSGATARATALAARPPCDRDSRGCLIVGRPLPPAALPPTTRAGHLPIPDVAPRRHDNRPAGRRAARRSSAEESRRAVRRAGPNQWIRRNPRGTFRVLKLNRNQSRVFGALTGKSSDATSTTRRKASLRPARFLALKRPGL